MGIEVPPEAWGGHVETTAEIDTLGQAVKKGQPIVELDKAHGSNRDERRRLSRELHDEVGQSLTALAMEAGAAASRVNENPELRQRLQSIQRLAETSMNTVRNLALLLRPSMLDDLGLVPALRWQAREVAKRTGMKVRVQAEDLTGDLSDEYSTCIYRVVQEALNNSVRHAHARCVRIQVSGGAADVRLAAVCQDRLISHRCSPP